MFFMNVILNFISDSGTGLDCLQKNSFKEEMCQSQIDALYECCNVFYKRQGEDAKTVSCPKVALLKLKMKQQSQGN